MLRPAAIDALDYSIARKPILAGEFEVYLTRLPILQLGVLEITGANAAKWTPDSIGLAQLADYPMEIVAMVDNELDGGASNVLVTAAGTDDDTDPLSGVATIGPSGYHQDNSKFFPRTFGAQFVTGPAADGLWKTISSVGVVCAADALGGKIKLKGIPAVSAFKGVFCSQLDDFTSKAQQRVAIQCGMDASAFTKPGILQEGRLTVSAKVANLADGLMRYNGGNTSALLIARKERKLVTEHIFVQSWGGVADGRGGEGETPVTASLTGPYEEMIVLPAWPLA
jgi:hypothetical protein